MTDPIDPNQPGSYYPPPGHPGSGYVPPGYVPAGYVPAGYVPAGYVPAGYVPAGYVPPGYVPAGYPPPPTGFAPPSPVGSPPPYGYPPAPRRSRATIVIVCSAVAALVATVAVIIAFGTSSTSPLRGPVRAITVPGDFADYQRVTSQLGQNVEDQMRIRFSAQSAASGGVYDKAVFAVYGQGQALTPDLIFVAVNAKDNERAREILNSASPATNADDFLRGAGADTFDSFPAGPLGGVLRCGQPTPDSSDAFVACVWMDKSTFGLTVVVNGGSEAALAQSTLALRTAAEH